VRKEIAGKGRGHQEIAPAGKIKQAGCQT